MLFRSRALWLARYGRGGGSSFLASVVESRAWWVAREGAFGGPVLAPSALDALLIALRVSGDLDAIGHLDVRRHHDGFVATIDDDEVWTVRAHRTSELAPVVGSDDAACQRALEAVVRVVNCVTAAVLLRDGAFLRYVAASGPRDRALIGVRVPVRRGAVGYVVRSQRPARFCAAGVCERGTGAIDLPDDAMLDAILGCVRREVWAVPICDGGVVFGAIKVVNPERPSGGVSVSGQFHRVERIAQVLGSWLARAV